jgi:hypothetical protein
MCWAATSANMLAWGGWGTATYSTATEIFDKFKTDFGDTPGYFYTALEYWFHQVDGEGYFPGYNYVDLLSGGNVNDLYSLLTEGYGLYTSIQHYGGHALSCWGYSYQPIPLPGEYTQLYYTDSNDWVTEMKSASLRKEGVWWYLDSGTYEDWQIISFDGLRARTLVEFYGLPIAGIIRELSNRMISQEEGVDELFFLRPFLSFDYKWEFSQMDSQSIDLSSKFLVQLEISEDNWQTLFEKSIGEEQGDYDWKSLNIPIDENFHGVQRVRFVVEGDGQLSLYRLIYLEPKENYAYEFSFTYGEDGDSYGGMIYADAEKYGITPNPLWTWTALDENGLPGTYVLSNATLAPEYHPDGKVYVNWYLDHESGNLYTPLGAGAPVGTDLGTERDYIIQAGIPEFRFGNADGILYEADLPARFRYTFTYSNGDSYTGSVYASQWDAYLASIGETWYLAGETWSTACEGGLTGTYLIGPVEEYLEDTTKNGLVTVDSYYDMEMGRTYIPTLFSGSDYLGSEYGFIVTNRPFEGPSFEDLPPGILKKFFGYNGTNSYNYEADVKQDKKKEEETTYIAQVAMNIMEPYVPYQPENEEKTNSKKAK